MTRVVIGFAILILVALAVAPPILFVAREPGAIDPADLIFVIRNPLRNRAPERAAARVLVAVRDGQCRQTLRFLDRSDLDHICSREREYVLTDWSVIGREDSKNESRIHFRVSRKGYGPHTWGNVLVTVERRQGNYAATGYITAY